LLFPLPPWYPELPTTPIIIHLKAFNYRLPGSIIWGVFGASKPWKQALWIAVNANFYSRKKDELIFQPPPTCPKPPNTPITLHRGEYCVGFTVHTYT
jgi:hypothetical protein